ncbi:MAG: DHA2 family efflux MFS transporter permease subunit [Chloroflexota bacterium]
MESGTYARRWWTLGVLALSLVLIGLDNTVLNVAIPTLQRTFDASAAELQWMVDAYVLAFAGLLLVMGALGDRFGRALALRAGLLIFGAASIGATFSTDALQLIVARAVMGVGGALIMPSTLSVIANVFPREERGRAIAIWAGVSGLGIGLGPIVGGALIENFAWTSVFWLNVPIVAVALLAGWFLVPESRDPAQARLDLPGAALSIAAVTALVYGIIEAPSAGWTDASTLAWFAAAIVGFGLFAWREATADEPMLDLALLRRPRFTAGAMAIGLTFFAMFAMIFGLTQYFQFVLGKTALEAGALMLALAFGIPIGAQISIRAVAHRGTRQVVAGALVVVAAVLVVVSRWDAATPDWAIVATLFALALGMANVMAPATDAVMGAVPEEKAGIGSAMNDLVRQLGGALGVAAIGSVMNTVYRSQMADAVAGLPVPAADAARDSVGAAVTIAAQLGPAGVALGDAARSAWIDALAVAGPLAAGIALLGAVLVASFLPAHHAERAALPAPSVP